MSFTTASAETRRPAVAGSFYPGERAELEAELVRHLDVAATPPAPAAVILPHAGYVFSGATAGRAMAAFKDVRVRRFILLGPSHGASFAGAALPDRRLRFFATPLGQVPLDLEALAGLAAHPEFAGPPSAHEREHCLEVELPFLQATAGAAPVVPILIGHGTTRELARSIAGRLAPLLDAGTVVVVSSDFTHHGRPYGWAPFAEDRTLEARLIELGHATAGRAAALDPRGFWTQVETSGDTVCGSRPIAVLLELLARCFEGSGRIDHVTTSAAVSRSLSQVVTYAAVSFTGAWGPWREEAEPPVLGVLDEAEQRSVLALARATLRSHLGHGAEIAGWFAANRPAGNLLARSGVFVTVNNTGAKARREGKLRGCIGVVEAREPLVDAVVNAATSAAHDPRFSPLALAELSEVALEVSVLSPMRPVAGPGEIRLGTHGVVLRKGGRSALFLPQVATETGWDLETFLSHLAAKAGFPKDGWRGAALEVFTAQVFSEPQRR